PPEGLAEGDREKRRRLGPFRTDGKGGPVEDRAGEGTAVCRCGGACRKKSRPAPPEGLLHPAEGWAGNPFGRRDRLWRPPHPPSRRWPGGHARGRGAS